MDFVKKQVKQRLGGSQHAAPQTAGGTTAGNPPAGTDPSLNQTGTDMGAQGGNAPQKDMLNKGMSFVQQHMGGQGGQMPQIPEGMPGNARLEGALRSGFKGVAGRDFPMGKPPGSSGV